MGKVQFINNIAVGVSHIGPHDIRPLPKFLYHFTSDTNADNIIKSGKLLAKKDESELNVAGVFMFDFENFIKNWSKLKINTGNAYINLFNLLFSQVAGLNKIACFRIPTQRLNKKVLIRDQNNIMVEIENQRASTENAEAIASIFDDAKFYKIYHQEGRAIEFIHTGDIKVQKDDLVGVVDIPEELAMGVIGEEPSKSALDTLKYLFINQPEAKMLESI